MGILVYGGAIAFDEYSESPEITGGRGTRGTSRTGQIAGASIDAALLELFPDPPALPGRHPGVSYLYADSATIKPLGNGVSCAGGYNIHDLVEITVTYAPLPYDSADLITRKISFSGEFMAMGAGSVWWSDGGTARQVQSENIAAGKFIPITEHSVTYHRLPVATATTIVAAIRANLGKVNASSFNLGGGNGSAAAETLLYTGAEMSFVVSTNGVTSYTIDHRFSEKAIIIGASTYGWNHFYRPERDGSGNTGWVKLYQDSGFTKPIYETSSAFGDLW